MLRLNRMTDYAIVVLSRLPVAGGRGTRTAQVLAEDTGVPLPTVAKILKLLVQAGVVVSQRGAAGGYALARPPERVSVADVIEALDGPIAITSCVDGHAGSCEVEMLCPMRGNWDKVNQAIRQSLSAVSLIDMMLPAWQPAATGAGASAGPPAARHLPAR
ncbi:MAG: SUF system Fe-S cluster assembly regulator [Thalassobaculales bacterium]